MRELLAFEVKKIIKKKSFIVTFLLLYVIQLFFAASGSMGATYVEDTFVETHAERNRVDRANGLAMSGRELGDELLGKVLAAYGKVDWSNREYLLSEVYQQEVRSYIGVIDNLKKWYGSGVLAADALTSKMLEELRFKSLEERLKVYEVSEKERAYWLEKEEKVQPPAYEYALGFEMLVEMNGGYMTCLLLTFFIAISMVTVFTEEHVRKTDQLILCTRHGRKKLYFAKILGGSMVMLGVNLFFVVTVVTGRLLSFGAEGFDAALQAVVAPWYPYPLSMGQVLLLMLGLLLLSGVMVTIFAMLLAELLRNSIGAMAMVVGLLLAARLVVLPPSLRCLSQAWNYLPINLLKVDQGFLDLRLVNIFGLQLTSWQFAWILYVIIIAVMVLMGERLYRRYQISGR